MLEISERLGVSVFAVVFEKDLKIFWVRNLSDLDLDKENDRWIQLNTSQYKDWIETLGDV